MGAPKDKPEEQVEETILEEDEVEEVEGYANLAGFVVGTVLSQPTEIKQPRGIVPKFSSEPTEGGARPAESA